MSTYSAPLHGRLTLAQHRELLVTIGWLALLLGCVHYDLGEREQAEAAPQAASQAGLQAGNREIIAWSYEMAAWFALTEGRYHDVADYAQAGQQHAGLTNAMIQLVLQQARGQTRLSQRREVHASLDHGAKLLEQLPRPDHPENHFVFDHTKWIFYAATCYTWLGDDEPAEEHARELIAYHTRPMALPTPRCAPPCPTSTSASSAPGTATWTKPSTTGSQPSATTGRPRPQDPAGW